MNTPLFLVKVLRAVVEVALLALIAQGLLAVLAGSGRARNPVYRLFALIASPVVRVVRICLPRAIADRHIGVVAACLLLWIWLMLAWAKALVG